MSEFSNEQLARLHTKLIVPFVVGDVLKNNEDMSPSIQYALHEALSEMDPDTALLAIALSTGHIAARLCPDVPVSCALKLETEKVVNEYGPDWLAHADGNIPTREGEDLFNVLEHIPEDLEAIADILDATRAHLDVSDPIAEICNILSMQARAHMEIADYILTELEGREIQKAPYDHATATGQNVIVFPGNTTFH